MHTTTEQAAACLALAFPELLQPENCGKALALLQRLVTEAAALEAGAVTAETHDETLAQIITEAAAIIPPTLEAVANEFPDFDLSTLPAIPGGFVDVSWHNDAMPAFEHAAKDLRLAVDYLEPEKSEFPDRAGRFLLCRASASETVLCETDDFAEVLRAIEAAPVVPESERPAPAFTISRQDWREEESESEAVQLARKTLELFAMLDRNSNPPADSLPMAELAAKLQKTEALFRDCEALAQRVVALA